MALSTIAAYKTYAGISGTGEDSVLTVLLDSASAAIRRRAGRSLSTGFESATYTENLSGRDSNVLQLAEWPVTSITSIKYVADDGTTTTVASTGYRVDSATGIVYRLGAQRSRFATDSVGALIKPDFNVYPRWDAGYNNIEAVYVGGYSTVPDDLKLALYRIMDMLYSERRQNPGMQSESLGGYSYSRAMDFSHDEAVETILRPFLTGEA